MRDVKTRQRAYQFEAIRELIRCHGSALYFGLLGVEVRA